MAGYLSRLERRANNANVVGSTPTLAIFFTQNSNFDMFEKVLPDRESNPGLPRDRRGYSPLYYRGLGI